MKNHTASQGQNGINIIDKRHGQAQAPAEPEAKNPPPAAQANPVPEPQRQPEEIDAEDIEAQPLLTAVEINDTAEQMQAENQKDMMKALEEGGPELAQVVVLHRIGYGLVFFLSEIAAQIARSNERSNLAEEKLVTAQVTVQALRQQLQIQGNTAQVLLQRLKDAGISI